MIDKNTEQKCPSSSIFSIAKKNMKLSLYSLEKGVTMNDEIVHWLEENKDVDVQVEVA
jgi:hypothetical protein